MTTSLCQENHTRASLPDLEERLKAQPKQPQRDETGHSAADLKRIYGSKTYWAWMNMNRRCYNPKFKDYENYGGKGISVCQRWRDSFSEFLKDLGPKPDGFLLDRIDRYGNYEPSNCRWANAKDSAINRSSSRFVGWDGNIITVTEAAKRLGRSVTGISRFLDRHPVYSGNASLIKMRKAPKWSELTDDQLSQIRALHSSGMRQSELSRIYSVPHRLIHRIIHGRGIRRV